MSFVYHGPLLPGSPLFQGRQQECAELMDACTGQVREYQLIYGSRQSGKTSLLLHLHHKLLMRQPSVHACCVDFQQIPEASAEQALLFLAQKIVESVPALADKDLKPERFPLGGYEFPKWLASLNIEGVLVLLVEELGALSSEARRRVANIFRAMFTHRHETGLGHVMIMLFGGIELHELAFLEVSAMHNVCHIRYLPDLSLKETTSLLRAGFLEENLANESYDFEGVAKAIYDHVAGHPCWTQQLGHQALEYARKAGALPSGQIIADMANVLWENDHHVGALYGAIPQYRLSGALARLLTEVPDFHADREMEQLRLLGIAKWTGSKWEARNPLLESHLKRLRTTVDLPATPHGLDMETEAALAIGRGSEKPLVFISYAHEDNEDNDAKRRWLERLQRMLTPYARNLYLRTWCDQQVQIGQEWHARVQSELRAAKAVVLLVSPAFLASDYILNCELPVILERRAGEGIPVFAILLAPSAYEDIKVRYPHPEKGPHVFPLRSIQTIPRPDKTLIEMNEAEQERALLRVAQELTKLFV